MVRGVFGVALQAGDLGGVALQVGEGGLVQVRRADPAEGLACALLLLTARRGCSHLCRALGLAEPSHPRRIVKRFVIRDDGPLRGWSDRGGGRPQRRVELLRLHGRQGGKRVQDADGFSLMKYSTLRKGMLHTAG